MFQLSQNERDELVTNWHQFNYLKHSSQLPFAFTEHGIAMLSSVLKSEIAIKMNIAIIKTFIKLRMTILSNQEIESRLISLENAIEIQFDLVFKEIESLKQKENEPRAKIGFRIKGQD